MYKQSKKLMAGIMAIAMTAASASASIAPLQASAVQVLGETDFEEKLLPWQIVEQSPAKQTFDIKDGTAHISVLVPEGGDKEKWDLAFRHRYLNFKAGHEYKVSFKVKAKRHGMELCSYIGNMSANEEYFELDGRSMEDEKAGMHMGPDMGGQWPGAPVKLTTEWQTFEGIFKPTKDLEGCQWTFQYAKGTKYAGNAMEGDEIWFDDMSIDCLTCGDEAQVGGCGWPLEDNLGIIHPENNVRVNQLGYFPNADKKATYATDEEKPAMEFRVVDKDGEPVLKGTTVPAGFDEAAGEYCQIIDFSEVKTPGTYAVIVEDKDVGRRNVSHEFRIGDDIYDGVLTNALNYYYQKRSGVDIVPESITSGDKNALMHKGHDNSDIAYVQPRWYNDYIIRSAYLNDVNKKVPLDVSGGWYDADNYRKSITSGGTALWMLQNMYEMSKKRGSDSKWADGNTMKIPPDYKLSGGKEVICTNTPDILDEARYELEFMFRMIVDPEKDELFGDEYAGFVYDQVREICYNPYINYDYISYEKPPRIINPPSYRATYSMIACAAQAARLWEGIDDDFAKECLDHAKRSWESIAHYRAEHTEKKDETSYDQRYGSYVSYHDVDSHNGDIDDDAYWAACELFATTGDDAYYNYLKKYTGVIGGKDNQCWAFGVPNYLPKEESYGLFSSFDRNNKIGCGTLSLYLSGKTSEADRKEIEASLKLTADKYLDFENDTKNGAMGVPYKSVQWLNYYSYPYDVYTKGYDIGSNSTVNTNAMIMAYAYDATGDKKYLDGALQAMDYIFGRNALGFSYVTGYGSYHVNNPVDEYWCNEIDKTMPKAPDGIMAGGPYTWVADNYVRSLGLDPDKTPPQKCYTDSVEAWSVNSHALDWQAGFAWNISFFNDAFDRKPVITTTTSGTTMTTTTTTTTTTAATTTTFTLRKPEKSGDANCDGNIDMSDVVLIMQAMANPNKYGFGGTDKNALTELGWANADVYQYGSGLTTQDALRIQEFLLGKIKEFNIF